MGRPAGTGTAPVATPVGLHTLPSNASTTQLAVAAPAVTLAKYTLPSRPMANDAPLPFMPAPGTAYAAACREDIAPVGPASGDRSVI